MLELTNLFYRLIVSTNTRKQHLLSFFNLGVKKQVFAQI
jgi:hypothetical protein